MNHPVTRRVFLPFLIFASTFPLAASGGLPVAKPESVGMSSERLDRVGVWLRDIVQQKQAAGFVTLVARHGKVVQHAAYGTRGMEVADAMPENALFDLASMTKPITVAAALMLLEEGRYTLTDPVAKYLKLGDIKVEVGPGNLQPAARAMTVEDLFTRTFGDLRSAEPGRNRWRFPRSLHTSESLQARPCGISQLTSLCNIVCSGTWFSRCRVCRF